MIHTVLTESIKVEKKDDRGEPYMDVMKTYWVVLAGQPPFNPIRIKSCVTLNDAIKLVNYLNGGTQ